MCDDLGNLCRGVQLAVRTSVFNHSHVLFLCRGYLCFVWKVGVWHEYENTFNIRTLGYKVETRIFIV